MWIQSNFMVFSTWILFTVCTNLAANCVTWVCEALSPWVWPLKHWEVLKVQITSSVSIWKEVPRGIRSWSCFFFLFKILNFIEAFYSLKSVLLFFSCLWFLRTIVCSIFDCLSNHFNWSWIKNLVKLIMCFSVCGNAVSGLIMGQKSSFDGFF